MWGNSDKYKEERAARTAAEQWAGSRLVAQNMVRGLVDEVLKDYKIPSPAVHIKTPDRSTWEIHVSYTVEGLGEQVKIETFDEFPTEELKATLMMLGLKK